MKQLFFIFLFFTPTVLISQTTSIPDPFFEEFLEANGMGDGVTNNGLVLTANIENVIELNLPNTAGIVSLEGIQDFMALEVFRCSNNDIVEVDFSQNLNLKLLGFGFNKISSLDLSNNINLEQLAIPGNSLLTNVTCNSNVLDFIQAFECNITELDIIDCPNLTFLDCHDNSLADIDISRNTELITLTIWLNNLSELDVSNNLNLEFLNASINNIESGTFVNNTELINFNISNNPELNYLDFRNGSNVNINNFLATETNDLRCIFVDNPIYSNNNDRWFKDSFTTFVADEAECDALLNSPNNTAPKIVIYPNPATTKITVLGQEYVYYKLATVEGKIIEEEVLPTTLKIISLEGLPLGVYFLSLIDKMGRISTVKIVKQ